MSSKRLERINACLKLDDVEESLEYKDRLFWIRKLSKVFNDNVSAEFNPSWLVSMDESMVYFYDHYSPEWMFLDKKPHPMRNEYLAIACCEKRFFSFGIG